MLIGLLGIALGCAVGLLTWKAPVPWGAHDVVLSAVLLAGIAVTWVADGDVAQGGAGVGAGVALALLVRAATRLTRGDAGPVPGPDSR